MTISLIDSASATARVLDAAPDMRADIVREMWAPMAGMYHFVPDGLDMASVHRQNFGFDWDGPSDELRQGLKMLVDADAWSRVAEALEAGVAALKAADPSVIVPDLTVLLVLGDPTNDHFVDEVQGLSGFGGISGYIAITVWPNPRVLDRLEAIAVHELHHNVRYSPGGIVWNPAAVTVGEHVISEGLADTFATELYGDAGYTHFVTGATARMTRCSRRSLRDSMSPGCRTSPAGFSAMLRRDSSAVRSWAFPPERVTRPERAWLPRTSKPQERPRLRMCGPPRRRYCGALCLALALYRPSWTDDRNAMRRA